MYGKNDPGTSTKSAVNQRAIVANSYGTEMNFPNRKPRRERFQPFAKIGRRNRLLVSCAEVGVCQPVISFIDRIDLSLDHSLGTIGETEEAAEQKAGNDPNNEQTSAACQHDSP